MNKEEILNFNYPMQSMELIEIEKEIKQELRNDSFNSELSKEIERFSDKYTETLAEDAIVKKINIELLSPELIEMFGIKMEKNLDVVQVEEASSEKINGEDAESKDDKESLDGGDDYSDYFNDEEELVNEDNKIDNKEDYIM